MNFTTTFSGWSDATGTSGVLLPLAYQTRLSYRNVGLDVAAMFNVLRLRTPLEGGVRIVVDTYTNDLIIEPLVFSLRL